MSEFDAIIHRLGAAAATLDGAIDRYASGDVRFGPPAYAHVLTKVAAGVIVTGGVVAVPLVAARTGDDGRGAPSSPSAASTATVPLASAPDLVGGPTLPGDGQTFTDQQAWDAIDWLDSLAPYGPEGNRYEHLIVQDQLEKCMNERGFEYHQIPFTAPPQPRRAGYVRVPPLPTEEQVKAVGYAAFANLGGASAPPPSSDAEDVPATTDPELIEANTANDELAQSSDWSLALYGGDTKVGSCIGDAFGFIEEQVGTEAKARYSAFIGTILQLAAPLDHPEGALAAALEEWRSCMGPLGGEVQSPVRAVDLYDALLDTEPSDEEIATALADLRCRQSSGFRDAYRDAMAAGIANFRYENEGRIDDLEAATRRETEALRELAGELGLLEPDA